MKAAIYTRVSTEKDTQEGGLESQELACRRFLETREDLRRCEVEVYTDQASGKKADRPGLKRLLQDAAMKRVRVLVVPRLDRLTRGGIREVFRILDALRGHGVRVYSVSEAWWDPEAPTSELILAVLAWAAQFESRSIGERVSDGIRRRRAEALARREPFRWGMAHKSRLVADPTLPAKAASLRAQGRSWRQIARELEVGRTTARRLCLLGQAENGPVAREVSPADAGPTT